MNSKFKKWWNTSYHTKKTIEIKYSNKIKVSFFKKILTNTVYVKCLIRGSNDIPVVRMLSGGNYDFIDSSESGVHVSIWLKYRDDLLLEKIRTILFQMGLQSIMSMSETRIHGEFSHKNPTFGKAFETINQFCDFLAKDNSYYKSEILCD